MTDGVETSAKPRKVLVIGLDGASWDCLAPLLDEGYMPNLRSLIERGSSGVLRSVVPPVTAPAWASFQTGKFPSKHGIVDFFTYVPWSYRYEFSTSEQIRAKTLWRLLSEAGKKVIVVNVPLTYPPEQVNGVLIPGFDTPDTSGRAVHPEGLMEILQEKMGGYRRYKLGWSGKLFNEQGLKGLIDELIDITDVQVDWVKLLMKEYPWDFCMYHFQVTDAFQHHAWNLVDRGHRDYARKSAQDKESARGFYRKIDEKIGELLSAAGDGVHVYLLSDHGFQSEERAFSLNHWLRDKDYLRESRAYFAWRLLDEVVSVSKRLRIPILRDMKYPLRRSPMRNLRRIDYRRTRAYAYGYLNNYALVVVNKKYRDVVEKLKGDIGQISENGRPIVKAIYPWYGGAAKGRFDADFVVEFEKGYSIAQKVSSRKKSPFKKPTWAGVHAIEGFFCMTGENIRPGFKAEACLVDMMPTILHVLGLPIPDDLDGRVMNQVFRSSEEATFIAADGQESLHTGRGKEDFEEVAKRLESLGYI